MRSDNVLRNTLFLTLSGILAKTFDFIFRVYYSRTLGSEGMGIFSLCLGAFGIVLNLVTGGVGIAVSKTVSEHYAKGRYCEAFKTVNAAISAVGTIGLLVLIIICCFSEEIAKFLIKEQRVKLALILISPSVIFMGISYGVKGYFYASRRVIVPASSEFLEQAVKITVIRFLLKKLLPYGTEYGCAAVCLGLSIGEFCSCVYLYTFYRRDKLRLASYKIPAFDKAVLLRILKISMPIMLSSILCSFLRMYEDVLIVDVLKKSGSDKALALSIYGEIHGMVMPFIVFPLTLLSSCFTLLVPEISRAYHLKNEVRLKTLISRLYRFSLMFGFFVYCIFFVMGRDLAGLLYNNREIAPYINALSLIAPFMFIDSVSAGILNGMGKQIYLFIYSILDSLGRILLIYLLMPRYGINSFIVIIIISNAFTSVLTFKKVIKLSKIGIKNSGRLWRHILAVSVTCMASKFFKINGASASSTVFGVAFLGMIYFVTALLTGSANIGDFKWIRSRLFSGT